VKQLFQLEWPKLPVAKGILNAPELEDDSKCWKAWFYTVKTHMLKQRYSILRNTV